MLGGGSADQLLNGIFIDDLDARGVDVPEIRLIGTVSIAAAVDLALAAVGVEGGVQHACVAGEQPHVAHIEIDAAERLDLARELGIMRTPTTLVLDSDGVVVARMDGAPSEAQAREALEAVPPPTDYAI